MTGTTTLTAGTTNDFSNYYVLPNYNTNFYPYTFSGTITTTGNAYQQQYVSAIGTGSCIGGTLWTVWPYDHSNITSLPFQRQDDPLRVISVPAVSPIIVGETWTAWNERYYRELAARVPQVVPPLPLSQAEEERHAARKMARSTLLSLLDEGQQAQLERESCFELRVDDRLYRIRPGNVVEQLHPATRKKLSHFCIHPSSAERGWLPEDDWAIAQKLLLEADEGLFLRLANRRDYA